MREFDESTHTAAEAAAAIGCDVAAIVKSLLFEADGAPLLVLASGPNRVDTAALGARLGATIGKADAAAVKQATGYSIGAVPPLGHLTPLRTVFDETLLELPDGLGGRREPHRRVRDRAGRAGAAHERRDPPDLLAATRSSTPSSTRAEASQSYWAATCRPRADRARHSSGISSARIAAAAASGSVAGK